ncbi:DUF2452 domain-containing protein [Aquimarina agarilytica]|uniref:DUF2452 domain-containing protein n=1 Tax=Aquimarina agarilytica TaxID=1087449 RepID=UPI00028975A2|nr:DUF2452 domain-containing protein [Aquimarina agarilytica]
MPKKPDQVVFDNELQAYNAKITPYATNVGAPKIEITDITHWKNNTINKVNHQLGAKFKEIQEEYQKLMQQYEYNTLIYEAKFSFEPTVGKIYHLYKKEDESTFLSLLSPQECKFNFIKSFRLNANQIWEVI